MVALTVAVLIARAALRGGGPSVAPNTCEATWSVSLGTMPDGIPRALIASGRDVWAAVTVGDEVQLLRTREGRRHQDTVTARLTSATAVRAWFADAQGVHLALTEGDSVRVLTPGGAERTVRASEVPAPQADLTALARTVAGAGALAVSAPSLDVGRVALWTTRDRDVTTLRYRLLGAGDLPVGAAGTLGELLATPTAERATVMAAAQVGPREAVMALATSHGPRMFHLRCGAAR